MSNPFLKLYTALREYDKQRQIESSGSTKESGNEKVRSGQSCLYKLHGMESEVIEVRFREKVWGLT